jgi:hypothetical protein
MAYTAASASSWEGSDDWIRLNFKWYLYSLLGCMIKEDLCSSIRNELESILFNSELTSTLSSSGESNSDSDKNSSTLSLNENANNPNVDKSTNDVVNIDDYIDKVAYNNKETNDLTNNEISKSNTTISTLSLLSNQYLNSIEELTSFTDYKDDFNSNYLSELRKTNWFKEWYRLNKVKLEKSLFKYNSDGIESQLAKDNQPILQNQQSSDSNESLNGLTNRFNILFTKFQELEQTKLNHPFNGQISVSDIKLKFNFLFTTTESGRKLNKALHEGGKIVNNTSRAVGDAFSVAKSTFSSFFSSWSSTNGNGGVSVSSPSKSPNSKSNTKA